MIKVFIIAILLVFGNVSGFSQLGGTAQSRDSLKHELGAAKTDTSRVLLMVKLANAYFVNFPDSLIKYARKALDLATAIRFSKGEAGALNALGLGFQFN